MSTIIRKAVLTEYGSSPDVVKIITEELPPPSENEVQVSILYAGFSGTDVNMRRGWYPFEKAAPLTLGYCFVGRVHANGPGAGLYTPGTLVTAITVYDSDADAINITEKHLVAVPEGLDTQKVAALTMDWNTAYGMVFRAANVEKGQRVFIHGLSGAIGYALLSLCKLRGATVYGTASSRNHSTLRALGAEPFVYTDKNWINAIKTLGGVHAVFDPLGYESYDESYSILTSSQPSILVGYGHNAASLGDGPRRSYVPFLIKLLARNAVLFSKKSTTFYYIGRDQKTFRPELECLFELVLDGKVDVPIKKVWDLEDVREAHASWGVVTGIGSLLLRIKGE